MKKTSLPPLSVMQTPCGVLRAGLFCLSLLFTAATASATTFTVTNTNNSGAGSLRQALTDANGNGSSPHTINITASGTITVTSELPAPVFATTINGNGCTISGGGTTRIFASMQANGADIAVTFNVLNFTAGSGSGGNGGAFEIRQGYRVTFTDCKFYSNTASGFGGAICYNVSGSQIGSMRPLVCTRCSFTSNSSTGSHSGGVDNRNGDATFTNCTFANNTAAGTGGAFSATFSPSISKFVNCTIANNSCGTASAGGGLALEGTKNMLNNIVYGNTANNVSNDIYNGNGTMTQVSNLVGTTTGTAVSWALTSNPNLGTITTCSNGISYLPLTTGSAAINAGSASGASLTAPSTDVCGAARSGNPDLGSSEFVTPSLPEIDVQGNGISIVDGDITPSTTDNTDFGNVSVTSATLTKTFTILNTGPGALTVTAITLSGTNAADFSVGGISLPATIAATNGSATFTVTFDPSATGTRTATLAIANDDSNENPYDFSVQGTGATPADALDFSNNNDYVSLSGTNSLLDGATQFTIEHWVESNGAVQVGIVGKGANDCCYNTIQTGIDPGGKFFIKVGNQDLLITDEGVVPTGTWVHLAAVYDGSAPTPSDRIKIYANGVLQTATMIGSIPATAPSPNVPFAIGSALSNGQYNFSGKIDELRIWNTARTCDQINQLRNCELEGNESGLAAYYKFNQGFAGGNNSATTTLTDATANGYNGTLINFTLNGTNSNWVTPGGVVTGTSCSPVTAPEVNVQGASENILDGDITPATTDGTDFGSISYSASVVRTFTIQNTGTAVLNITSLTSSNAKYVIGSAPTSVAANSSATFTVTFTPAETGTHTATITINNDDCDESAYDFAVAGTATFPVTTLGFDCVSGAIGNYYNGGSGPNVGIGFPNGTAVNAALDANTNPVINVPPGFTTGFAVQGNVCIGYTITIYSGLDGTGTVLATQTGNPGLRSVAFSGIAKSVTLSRYSCPLSGYDNLTFGSTTIGTTVVESPREINLQGNSQTILDGDATPATTDGTDHGIVVVNAPSVKTFTILNTGTADLTVSTITKTGTNQSEFVVSGITLPATIAAGGSTTFTVTFTPTATGLRSAVIQVNNNDCDEAVYDFAVQGMGGVPGAGLAFDGSDDYVNVPYNAALNITGNVTLEAWVKTSTSTEQYIISRGNTSYLLAVNPANAFPGKAAFWVHGPSSAWLYSNTSIDDGNWHHLAGVRNGTTVQLFIDGVLDATGTVGSGTITTSTDPVAIGWRSTYPTSVVLNGSADEVRIWSVARSCEQINQLRNCELVGNESGLVAYYKFNQGFAGGNNSATTTLTDATANGLNGTLTNFALTGPNSNWVTPGGVTTGTSCSSVIAAEINVQGTSINILDGDNTPATTDGTDFGTATSRTFTIQNTGDAALTISAITRTGTNASDFSISGISLPATVSAGGSTTFTVNYTITGSGIRTATINIANDDCTESTYDFAIQADGCTTPAFSACPTNMTVNTEAGLCTTSVLYIAEATGSPAPTLTYAISGVTTGSGSGTGAGTTFNKGVSTVTVTATNLCGAPTCVFNVTVNDNQAPNIGCPAAVSANANVGSCFATEVALGTATATDNCGTPNITQNAPTSFPVGATTVIWTATDASGLTATCAQVVTVNDNQNPTITCPAAVTANTDAGLCTASGVALGTATGSDNCGTPTFSNDAPSVFQLGSTTVTWIANDGHGNTVSCFQTVTVNDNQNPTIACPATVSVNADAGICTASGVSLGTATGSDNCGTVTFSNNAPTTYAFGNTTVIWTADDSHGNTASCAQIVTVNDNQNPTITCPAVVSVNADAGICTASSVALGTATGSDNCGTTTFSNNAPTTFPVGNNTVIWTANDGHGNTATCAQTVTVIDNQAPTAVCQNYTAQLNASGTVTITGANINNNSTDNCGIASLSVTPNTFTCASIENNPHTVTLTVTDNSGNTAACTALVTVADNVPPTTACQNLTVQLDGNGQATITADDINNGSTDACGIASTSINVSTFDCDDIPVIVPVNLLGRVKVYHAGGVQVYDLTAANLVNWNNFSSCSGKTRFASGSGLEGWQWTDVLPSGTAVTSVEIQLSFDFSSTSASRQYFLNGALKGSQAGPNDGINCAGVNASFTLSGADYTAGGSNTFSWDLGASSYVLINNTFSPAIVGTPVVLTVTDIYGNSANCTAYVTAEDNVAPVALCKNSTVALDATGHATIAVSDVNNGSSDNCGIASMELNVTQFTCANVGPNTVTLTVFDNNNITNTCTATVTVQDLTAPTAVCQNATVQLNAAGTGSITAAAVNNGSSDNCGIQSLALSQSAFTCANTGANTVTLTVTDVNANTTTCTATVTVQDLVAPTALCQNVSIQLDANGAASTTAAAVNNGSSDACGIQSTTLSQTAFTCSNVGANTVTLTVTDVNANTATCTATVTVQDLIAPTAVCQNVTVQLDANGTASTTAAAVNNGSSDNCGVQSLSLSQTAFTCANTGANTVTLTVTDVNANTATCTATVTVQDLIAPTAVCQNATVTLDANGAGTLAASAANNGSSDNCSIQSLSLSQTSFTCANVGANAVTLTVTDPSGNTATCAATVTVEDNIAPTVVCQNVTVQLNAAGQGSATASQVVVTSDNCGIASMSLDQTSFTCSNVGANNVTVTVTDNNGNTATCAAVITVQDQIAPTALCQNATIDLDASGTATIAASAVNNGSSDACGIQSLTLSQTAFTCANAGANNVTLTVKDVNNNTSTCTAVVTVRDLIAPTALCQNATVTLDANGAGTLAASAVNNGSSDNCSIQSLSLSQTSFTCANVGANTVTLTVSDNSSNTATCTATVTVVDNTAPTAVCQNATVNLNASGAATITAANVNNGSSDACGIAATTLDISSFNCPNIGANTVTLTVTDVNNNTATCTATVTVQDIIAPTITCPANVAANTDAGLCTATNVSLGSPSGADNCGTTNFSNNAPTTYTIGANAVTWTVNDGHGNTATCIQTVTVTDNQLPTITCPTNVTVNANTGACNATGVTLGTPTMADNCGIQNTSNNAPASYALGVNTVVWTTRDAANNTATCAQTVTVIDNQAPVINCPAGTLTTIGSGSNPPGANGSIPNATSYQSFTASASGLMQNVKVFFNSVVGDVTLNVYSGGTCQGNLLYTQTYSGITAGYQTLTLSNPLSLTAGSQYNFSVTASGGWTFQWSNSNPYSGGRFYFGDCPGYPLFPNGDLAFNIDILTAPNTNLALNSNCQVSMPNYVPQTTGSDNCGTPTITQSPAAGTILSGVGTQTVTMTATDGSGNASTCSFDVTKVDNTVPTITCPATVNVNTDAGQCTATNVDLGTPGAADNCGTTNLSNNAPTTYQHGNTTVRWTVNDGHGNTATCNQTVTVTDVEAPNALCQNVTVQLNASGTGSTTAAAVNNGSTDNCAVQSLSLSKTTFNCSNVGANTVTLTVTDNHTNTSTCTAIVTVEDNIAPVAVCQNVTIALDANGAASTTAAAVNNGSSDACGIASLALNVSTFNCTNIGANTVTLTVTDNNSNTATCTATVTVQDNIAPVISCPTNVTVNTDAGICTASGVAIGTATATDNCSTMTISNNAISVYPLGVTNVTWTVNDGNGNTASCIQTVTVEDHELPTITCPADKIVNTDPAVCQATGVALGNAVATDNCTALTVSNNGLSIYPKGTTTVIWTADDGHGNTVTCTQTVTVEDNEAPNYCSVDQSQTSTNILYTHTERMRQSFTAAHTGTLNKITVRVGHSTGANVGLRMSVLAGAGPTGTVLASKTFTTTASNNTDMDVVFAAPPTVISGQPYTYVVEEFPAVTGNLQIRVSSANPYSGGVFYSGTASALTPLATHDAYFKTFVCGCPNDVFVNADAGICDATNVNLGAFTPTDNCDVPTVSNDAPGSFPLGVSFVTWTAQDASGNIFSCEQVVTVEDNEVPVITCPANLTVNTDAGACQASNVALGDAVATDNCNSTTQVVNDAPSVYPVGVTTINWLADDSNDNTATCTQTVTVRDIEAPTAVCQNLTLSLNAAGAASTTAAAINNGSSDACGIASMTINNSSFGCSNVGANTVTLTVTDNNANTATCTATVTVVDAIAPVVNCQNVSVSLNASGTGATTAAAVNNASYDACGIATMTLSKSNFDCTNVGANTVTLTVTDVNGNSATCNATVTVTDAIAPIAICQNSTVQLAADGTGSIAAAQVDNGSSDACGIQSLALSQTSFNCAQVGANTVTLTVTDVNSNTATCTATITVVDAVAPVAVCQNVTVSLNANGTGSTTAAAVNNGSSDACGIASTSLNITSFNCSNVGANPVTLTVTDVNGNSSTCSATVTVVDAVAPVAVCQNVSVSLDANGTGSTTAAAVNNGSSDACGIASTSLDITSFNCSNVGANTVILTVTDVNGNSSTCTATVTVTDAVAPVAVCQNVTVSLNAAGTGSTTAAAINNGSSDACGIASLSINNSAFTCANVGANNVTLTVTDNNGNTSTCAAVVTVQDLVAPNAICRNVTVQLGVNGTASTTVTAINNGSSDACGIASMTIDNSAFTCANAGANTVTLTVTDVNGNVSTCTSTVTVQDIIAPVIACPAGLVADTDPGICTASNLPLGTATATDNCSVSNISSDAPAAMPKGINTVIWTATDASGNTATCTQIVEVQDNQNPIIACPADITVGTDPGTCTTTTVALGSPTATDNCGAPTVSNDAPSVYLPGQNEVVWTAVDAGGLTTFCVQTVTVQDNEGPVMTCPAPATIPVDAGACQATGAAIGLADAVDNCSSANVFDNAPAVFPLGSTTVTWTAFDEDGNTSTCTQLVTVVDNQPPSAICQNTSVSLNASGAATITVQNIDNGSTDNCGISNYSLNQTAFNCSNIGANLVMLTVTDNSGNTAACAATVTVSDNTAPVAQCQNMTAQLNASGIVTITAASVNNGSSDACGIASFTLDETEFDCAEVGTNTVVLTVTDVNGNSSTCSAIITVQDQVNPTAICQNVTVQLGSNGTGTLAAASVNNGSFDACGIATTTLNNTSFTCANVGANTVVLTVTDVNGNSSNCSAIATVQDQIAPVALCHSTTVALNAAGAVTIAAADINNGSSDACGIASTTLNTTNFGCSNVGANTVTLTITDVNGNTNTCTATVTVQDNIAPVVTCQNATVNLSASGLATITAATVNGGVTDACGIATTTVDISSFNCSNVGANTVVFTATDTHGNSATCNATVTIQDVTAPTTLCHNLNVNLDNSGNATITVGDIDNGSTDVCGIQNSVLSKTTFDCSNTGANTVTLTVTDINGNAGTCTATVTVTDNIAPLAICQDLNVQLSASGNATITANDIDNGASDNCGIAATSINVSAFNCSNLGANTVTLTATDNHGNSATCNATVTVTAIDTDNDGTSDCSDLCPNDPLKTSPGTCGCGTPDTDTDGDGTPDCNDLCPNDPNSTVPGPCGCGVVGDYDNDGIPNDLDIYPNDCYNGGKGVVFTRVWNDLNGNGLQDVGEPGIAGAGLRLRNATTDVQLQTGTTNTDGYILFFNVTNSTSVRLEMTSHVAAPYNAAKPNIGTDDNYDSDFDRVLNPLRVQSANFTVNGVVSNQDCGVLLPGSVQAFVWDDANDNGMQDVGENGVSNVTVRLRDGVSNTTSQTQTSNGSGLVTFNNVRVDGLDAISWRLEFVKPTTKHVYANADQGSDDTIDSDASTTTGYTNTFSLTLSAEAVTKHDAGFLLPGTIEAFVWQDGNDNGIQDVGEGPLSNVTVRLRDASTNGISQTKTTNASGIATFTAVTPRYNWKLEFVKPSGDHVYALQDQGSNDALDSDPATTGHTANFQITSGQNYNQMDAGFILPGAIQAYVWHDANNNGVQDGGEAPIQGVTVRLLNGNTDAISQTQTSNASGIATFSSVAARTNWKLEFVKPSANHQYAFQDQGGDDATDSDPSITNGRTAVFQLSSGASVTNIDGGFLLPGTVTAYVWNDLDGNGIQNAGEPAISGATVELRDGNNDNLVSSTITNASGTVTFSNVAPRTNWKLGFVKPSANHTFTLQNQGSDDAADSDAAASNGRSDVFQINSAADYTNTDAGFMLPGSIQSYVWHDANDNGAQDGGESPLSGVTVRLLDGTTNVTVDTKITGADGLATFSNVTPNYNWKLEYVKPTANHVYAFKDQGGNDANDSDMDETNGRTDVFTIGSGQNYQNTDGGFLLPGNIESYVWNDANSNGCQDEGTSAAVAGVSVRLRNASNNGLLQIKTTNANGIALFTNVKPRTNYKIEFIKPAAATAFTTLDNCSGNDASDSDAALSNGQTTVFQILSAEASTIWDAGLLIPSNAGGAENRDETIATKPENIRVLDEMILFPVPTTDQLTVAFRANMAAETRYRVFDRIGNLVTDGKWNVEQGDNQFILETANLPSGIYHISVVANDGILTKQFMIVR